MIFTVCKNIAQVGYKVNVTKVAKLEKSFCTYNYRHQ